MHRSRRVFPFSKQSRNSFNVMPFNASVVFFCTSSTSAKRFPLRNFSFGGIKISGTERDGVIMAGGEAGSCCFWLKIVLTLKALCAAALSWWSHHSFHLQFLAQNPLAGTPGHTRQIKKIVSCSATVFQDQFTNSRDVCIRSGRSRVALSEVGQQVTIHHSWSGKTTRKLVFFPVQLPCKLFQALQLFPLPFSLTENRISQPHIVPTFQPSQKSTNKWEALNKKIYYMARLNLTMLVGRLMQKGPRKRHLVAEACTTMDPPTREHFRFLLGPPTYFMHSYLFGWVCLRPEFEQTPDNRFCEGRVLLEELDNTIGQLRVIHWEWLDLV